MSERRTMLNIAQTAFQQGITPLYPNLCPGDIPEECYEARRHLDTVPADIMDLVREMERALESIASPLCPEFLRTKEMDRARGTGARAREAGARE